MQNNQTTRKNPASVSEYNGHRQDSENRFNADRNLYGSDSTMGSDDAFLPEQDYGGQIAHHNGEVIIIL